MHFMSYIFFFYYGHAIALWNIDWSRQCAWFLDNFIHLKWKYFKISNKIHFWYVGSLMFNYLFFTAVHSTCLPVDFDIVCNDAFWGWVQWSRQKSIRRISNQFVFNVFKLFTSCFYSLNVFPYFQWNTIINLKYSLST